MVFFFLYLQLEMYPLFLTNFLIHFDNINKLIIYLKIYILNSFLSFTLNCKI